MLIFVLLITFYSITSVLLDLKLSSFDTLIHNYRYSYNMKLYDYMILSVCVFVRSISCFYYFLLYFLYTFYVCLYSMAYGPFVV